MASHITGFKELKIALEFLYFLTKCDCEDLWPKIKTV